MADISEHKEERKLIYQYQYLDGLEYDDYSLNLTLGTKGAMLCSLSRLCLPIPNGFIISRESCSEYLESGVNELSINH